MVTETRGAVLRVMRGVVFADCAAAFPLAVTSTLVAATTGVTTWVTNALQSVQQRARSRSRSSSNNNNNAGGHPMQGVDVMALRDDIHARTPGDGERAGAGSGAGSGAGAGAGAGAAVVRSVEKEGRTVVSMVEHAKPPQLLDRVALPVSGLLLLHRATLSLRLDRVVLPRALGDALQAMRRPEHVTALQKVAKSQKGGTVVLHVSAPAPAHKQQQQQQQPKRQDEALSVLQEPHIVRAAAPPPAAATAALTRFAVDARPAGAALPEGGDGIVASGAVLVRAFHELLARTAAAEAQAHGHDDVGALPFRLAPPLNPAQRRAAGAALAAAARAVMRGRPALEHVMACHAQLEAGTHLARRYAGVLSAHQPRLLLGLQSSSDNGGATRASIANSAAADGGEEEEDGSDLSAELPNVHVFGAGMGTPRVFLGSPAAPRAGSSPGAAAREALVAAARAPGGGSSNRHGLVAARGSVSLVDAVAGLAGRAEHASAGGGGGGGGDVWREDVSVASSVAHAVAAQAAEQVAPVQEPRENPLAVLMGTVFSPYTLQPPTSF